MTRPRAADDFTAIRARIGEPRHERERTQPVETDLQRDLRTCRARTERLPDDEISTGRDGDRGSL